ncbi:MAG TPA: DUF308 domain-containing protein [Candidatus Limicola stercorigallinarum]|nr:DUF308 domain-containing protein [Candidatus Limicola stercorigallinarum]
MNWYDANHDYVNEYIDRWNQTAGRAKVGMIVLGVVLAIAGVAVILAPMGAYLMVQAVIAAILIVHGIGQVATYIQTPEFFRNGAQLASGILNAALGIVLLVLPSTVTAGAIIYMLAFLLIMTGIERISFARQMRFYQIPASSMGTATGVLNIILGVAFIFMPLAGGIALSYLLATYLIAGGITLVVEGVSIKKIER